MKLSILDATNMHTHNEIPFFKVPHKSFESVYFSDSFYQGWFDALCSKTADKSHIRNSVNLRSKIISHQNVYAKELKLYGFELRKGINPYSISFLV